MKSRESAYKTSEQEGKEERVKQKRGMFEQRDVLTCDT